MSDIKAALISWALFFAIVTVIFLIWRAFVRLAERNNKIKWPFGLLGVLIFVVGVSIGTVSESLLGYHFLSGLLRLPFGLLSCWLLYKFLKTKWEKDN